jgi:serine/threonine protein kinase
MACSHSASQRDSKLMEPLQDLALGRYELGQPLGSGGFATVYRARDKAEDREVAVKVIPLGDDASAQLERVRNEALAVAGLRSRFIARVHDFGLDDKRLYLVMDYVDGIPLERRAIGRALLPHEVIRVSRGLVEGLATAHEAGIVHRDIKPSNVLLVRDAARAPMVDEPRILDFGIALSERRAQVQQALGQEEVPPGFVLGTPAYLAPEQLAEGQVGPPADIYAVGLVLFDLLGQGTLFPGETLKEQLVFRMKSDPLLEDRVPPPLLDLLRRMLARHPVHRFADAREALAAIVDLETAPVSVDSLVGKEARERAPGVTVNASIAPPLSARPTKLGRPSSRPPPGLFGARRLSRLEEDPVVALREALGALDLAMIDALGRRERGSPPGRVARAVSLALRLELDAAALIVEPLVAQSLLARAFGSTLIAPRARRVTRARIDSPKDDWITELDAELASMLGSLGAAMTTRDDARRAEERCARLIERVGDSLGAASTTLRIARACAACLAGSQPKSFALAEITRLKDESSAKLTYYDALMRALLVGALGFRADEHLAREQLERAARLAAEAGATLLETRAMVAWGGMLVEIPRKVDQGVLVLERATTLLAHGDAPSLEHIAEHNRGAALIVQGRYDEAVPHFRRAREAAHGERSLEHEMLSSMNEAWSLTCLGDQKGAARVVAELADSRLASVSARTAAFAHLARSLYALAFQDLALADAERKSAEARAREAEADGRDAYLVTEALALVYAAARGEAQPNMLERAGELEKQRQQSGFAAFYWFDVLRAAASHMKDEVLRGKVQDALSRLMVLLGPAERIQTAADRSRV